jgi:hypothetical protein
MSRWWAAVVSLMVAAGSAYGATVPREILWLDKEHVQPMFIPAELLNERNWDELPWSAPVKDSVQFMVEEASRFKLTPAPACTTLDVFEADPKAYPATPFGKVVGTSQLAVLGKVIDRVPGWSTYENRLVTMVYIRVEEVLRDVQGDVKPGDVTIVRDLHGDMTVHGARLCVNQQPAYAVAAPGDEVLVIGRRLEGDARFVTSHLLYPVEAGRVSTRAFTRAALGAVPLDSVRAAAAEGRKAR